MKFLTITIISLALIVFANAGYLQNPHVLHSNSISSYSSQQAFPGASSYQSYETLGLPLPGYSQVPAITQNHIPLGYPYATSPIYSHLSYIPRQHVTLAHPQFAAYPIHNQPALIAQNPTLIQQYPTFIQQPTLVNPQAPPSQGFIPQNPIEQQNDISNIPSGAQDDADTVSIEAARSSNNNNGQVDNDDSVAIEAAPRFRSSNNTTQAIFSSTTESPSSSAPESSSSSTESNLPNARSNNQQNSIEEQIRNLNQARLNLQSNPGLISRAYFGNPAVFARLNLQ